jgi:hypothetical protein
MADVQTTSLYEQDFNLWAIVQARALRLLRDAASGQGDVQSALNAIDWDELIEELEGLAKRDLRELQSRIITIVEHLAKLELSSAADRRAGWMSTVRRERREIELLLCQSPSFRREVAGFLTSRSVAKVVDETIGELSQMGEAADFRREHIQRRAPDYYLEAQVLEDWWPDQREPSP